MKAERRILYAHNSADIYGASRSLLRLLPQVRSRGFAPVVMLPEEGPLRQRIEELGVPVFVDPGLVTVTRSAFNAPKLAKLSLQFPRSVWRVRERIRSEKADLVHTNTGVIPAPALAAKVSGVPHIWHVRDSFLEFRSLWKVYRRYITGLSERVITVSNPIAGQFPGARNVVVIHNGVSMDEFPRDDGTRSAAFRERWGLGNELVIGCVGRIKFVRKGQEVLMDAAAILKRRGVKAKYLIVGSPAAGNEDHLVRLRERIEQLGLAEEAVLTGEMQDVKPAYAAMDIFVLPSSQPEPFGGVVLEAMGMGLPVVATAIGGSLDQVEEGRTGFLVPPADPEAMAEKLALLAGDAALRRRMGEAGRERLEKRFSLEEMADRLAEVYWTALDGGRVRGR